MAPRSVFTPSFSSPRFSILPTTPTAEMTRSAVDGLRAALAVVDGRGDAIRLLVELGHLGAGQDLDPLLFELLARKGRNLGILGGKNLRQHLDHRHLGAEGAVERGELDADRARADDQQRFRHPLRHHGLEIGPDQLPVRLEPWQHARPRAGGDDDVLGLVGAGAQCPFRRLAPARLHRRPCRAPRSPPRPRSRRPCSSSSESRRRR